jgi:hypothetical protein
VGCRFYGLPGGARGSSSTKSIAPPRCRAGGLRPRSAWTSGRAARPLEAAVSCAPSSQARGGLRERSKGYRKCAMSASRAFLNTRDVSAVPPFLPSWMSRVRVSSPAPISAISAVAGAPSRVLYLGGRATRGGFRRSRSWRSWPSLASGLRCHPISASNLGEPRIGNQ